jgi:membrane associated rhomboid family serine protease
MLQSIWDDVQREFRHGNMVSRLVIANVSVFIFIWVLYLLMLLTIGHNGSHKVVFDQFVEWFCMPADWKHLLMRPWSIITNMFLHQEFFHILFNMLFLYWFGRIVGDLIGDSKILPLYLLGGLAGASLFFVFANIFPGGSFALGASAAVMALVVAAGVLAPDYLIRLMFIGDVRLKYIVLVLLVLDLVSIGKDSNTGGHIAHLGGAAMGWFFIAQMRLGTDLSIPINNALDAILGFFRRLKGGPVRRPQPRVVYRNTVKANADTKSGRGSKAPEDTLISHQEQLDAILDKIKQSGYDSLNAEEKEFLFKASNRH